MRDGWQSVSLGEVLERVVRPTKITAGAPVRTLGVRWYGAGCFAKDNTEVKAKQLNAVAGDDIVYSRLFAWKGSFGVVPSDLDGVLASTEFPTFLADQSMLLPTYFAIWSSRPVVWAQAEDASTGTTGNSRNRLSPDAFLDLTIELPSLAEQRAIVDAVRVVEDSIAAWSQEGEAANQAQTSVREHLLRTGDVGELPERWELVDLDEVAEVRSGITKGRKTRGTLTPVPFLRAANVQDGFLKLDGLHVLDVTVGELSRFALAPGDVLMIEGGNAEHLGRGWRWDGQVAPAVFQNHVFRARPKGRVTSEYLAHAIAAQPAREHCLECAKKTTNLASINRTQIGELPIILPPMEEQRVIAERLDALRAAALAAERRAAILRVLRDSLVDELVAGVRILSRPGTIELESGSVVAGDARPAAVVSA